MATRTGYWGTQSTGDVLTSTNLTKTPNGLVAYVTSTSTTSSIGTTITDITGLSLTFTFASSRMYELRTRVRFNNAGTNLWVSTVVRTSGGTLWGATARQESLSGADQIVQGSFFYAPSSGSTTLKVSAGTNTSTIDAVPGTAFPDSTGTISTGYSGVHSFSIWDWGPSF